MKILIVPDSFKGSLTSSQVCSAISEGLGSEHEITALPFADGGEGFAECMKNICKGETFYSECSDIYGKRIKCPVTVIDNTAVIESASASGLQKRKQIMSASSYGTGELIKFAYSKGYKNIILGLGGTGSCDGGAGALSALGADFFDESYEKIKAPCGGDLNCIFGLSLSNIVKDINFTYACDVENTFFGKNGAAYVFAPQKGANKTEVEELDKGLKRLNAFFKTDLSKVKGSGAAGGLCGGLYAVYGGEIKSGFEILSEYSVLEEKIKNYDLVITGEGKTDRQTLMGKLPFKISELAKKHGKKCVIISGTIEGVSLGDKMISLTDNETSKEYAIENAYSLLVQKSKFILQ